MNNFLTSHEYMQVTYNLETGLNITHKRDFTSTRREYGIDEDSFVEYIHSYVSENHYDSSIHDIDLDWQTNNYEIVKMIIEEALSE